MSQNPESFRQEITQLSQALRAMDRRLRTEAAPDVVALNELRQALDNLRLTAWTVSELINARQVKEDPNTVLSFLAGERLRRLEQLARNVCGDLDRGVLTVESHGMASFVDSMIALQQRLAQRFRKREQKSNHAAG